MAEPGFPAGPITRYTKATTSSPRLRSTFDLGLNHEDAIELNYNATVTPWLSISPSLQIISPALNKALDSSGNFKDLDTTYIAGVRVGVRS